MWTTSSSVVNVLEISLWYACMVWVVVF